MTDYEPGTVATILVDGCETTGLATGDGWMYADSAGAGHLTFDQVHFVRSLIMLDLADGPPGHRVIGVLNAINHPVTHWLADQIEAQTRPPKPAEPTGLGAVVKDREGHVWCRIHESYGDFLWRMETPNTSPAKYADIDAVEVLSPGVTP